MDKEEFNQFYREPEVNKQDFHRGYECGIKEAKRLIKRNKMLNTLLLEAIGYEDEWLTTEAGYKKYNNRELIEIIFTQRALIRSVFNMDPLEKETLKIKIEKLNWQKMHEDKKEK